MADNNDDVEPNAPPAGASSTTGTAAVADAIDQTSEETSEELGKKVVGGFAWAIVTFLLMQLGSFGSYTVASRVLGADGIGVVGAALTVVFYIDVLLDLGMGASVIYEQEKGQSRRISVAFTVNSAVAVVLAAAVFLGSSTLDAFFGAGDPRLFQVVAILVLAKGMNQIPDALLKRELDFRKRAAAGLVRAIARFTIASGLLLAGVGPIAVVIGVASAEVLGLVATWWLARFVPRIAIDGSIASEMLKFGLGVFGARLAGMLWLNGDYLVLARKYESDSDAFGNYFTAFRLPELVLGTFYVMFSTVAFPAFSRARAHGSDKLIKASLGSLRALCLVGFPVGIGISLIAHDFVPFWFGDDFLGAVGTMQILAAAGGFAAVGYASGDLYSAIGRPRLGMYFALAFTPFLLGGMWMVADRGIEAVAWVHVVVIIPYSAFRIEVANRLIGTTWRQSLIALRPAMAATAGLLAAALPVRLWVEPSVGRLALIILAGAVGAAVGLLVGSPSTVRDFRENGPAGLAKIG